jgi:hypothetical protein
MVLDVLSKYGMKMIQKGGARAMGGQHMGFFAVFMMALLFLLIKSYLVYLTWNILVDRGVITMMRPVTFGEAIMMVILFNNLFH